MSVEAEAHRRVLALPPDHLQDGVAADAVREIVSELVPLAESAQHDRVVERVVDRLHGLGAVDELLRTDGVTDVLINGPGPVWVERHGRLERTPHEVDADELARLVERMVAPLGRRLDRTSPLVDGRLPDGSRVHVAAGPVGLDGPYVTIRRFAIRALDLEAVATAGTAAMLRWAVAARANIVVCGGTGSGKTTLLNALAGSVDPAERIVTIEDAAELSLAAPHVVRLEARPAQVDGPPAVTIRELVRTALRMRPDRIVVGEVRGPEVVDMLQAMNTGHDGSLSTVHANTPADALRRLETLVLLGAELSERVAQREVSAAIDLIVHMQRVADGARRISSVVEPALDSASPPAVLADAAGLRALPTRMASRPVAPPSPDWLEAGR